MDEQTQQLIQMGQQIKTAAEQGDQNAAQIVEAAKQIQSEEQLAQIQQAMQQGDESAIAVMAVFVADQYAQSAKFGAKLNYIKSLRGICPDGYEVEYFKAGGQICKKCVAKKKQSTIKKEEGGNMSALEAFRCGGKKKAKKEEGGEVEMDKCGKKMKKAGKGCRVSFNQGGTGKKGVTKRSSDGTTYTQTQKNDGNGNIVYERIYKGYKPVRFVTDADGDGASFYQDHLGRARVEDQDSLATMYENGPIETTRRFGLKKKKINKHLKGGNTKKPFTGFEGLSYKYTAPNPSTQDRADRPEIETIYNNEKYLMDRERFYDADLYEESKQLNPIEDFIYSEQITDNPTEAQIRLFNSLKRHSLNNK